ncbi:MAG TPA: GH116 family glycosyl-hydrolase [Puia sp.]|nr:GH116 family glycosyl-hydrolase [Puia sp.]
MKKILFFQFCLLCFNSYSQQNPWPVVKHYEGKYVEKIAMPVGGIGTGNISIGGNGQWKDVEIMNKPGMGFYGSVTPKQAPCFMVFTETSSGEKHSKLLAGPISPSEYTGSQGSLAPNHGLPRFATASFDTGYPFAIVNLSDDGMPISAKAKVFNPYIPGNDLYSGIPIAVIRYEIKNKTSNPLTVAVAGSLDNFIGMDGSVVEFDSFDRSIIPQGTKNNRNIFKRSEKLSGIYMSSDSVPHDSNAWGTIALTTPNKGGDYDISYRTQFSPKGWNDNLTDMWDDFSDDGKFRDVQFDSKVNDPRAALSVKFKLAPNETREIEFFLTWDFPNRKDWNDKVIIGNYYSTFYEDAWDVAEKTIPLLPKLEAKTIDFVNLIAKSDYPEIVKEAALFNSSTLRSQTTFRNKEGYFFGWEGVFASTGSCYGNCTHVWNYEEATPFLFGSLALKMREVEYQKALDDSSGLMSFRVSLPFDKKNNWKCAAADGQMGTIMKVYREWQLSGDDKFLHDVWPGVKKALSFAWIKGGWDADRDGVMEGCQHNTMDIEYYGPNPEIEFWYLGALKAASKMAEYLKDSEFQKTCTKLFENGSRWTDQHLFNGEYYIQQVRPVENKSSIASGLLVGMGSKNLKDPDFQIGEGCLVDQLVGQNMAWICGLGYLADSSHIRKTLQSIWRYNHVSSFGNQFNNMRSYALGDESGMMLTSYPDPAKRPHVPLSYGFESWTGLEYTAAAGMMYEGMYKEALHIISDTRNRYDGYKRNPFNEEECGNHYARAMASWSALIAFSQFNYSAVEHDFSITARHGNYFWSNGYAWGNAEVSDNKVLISVHYGNLRIRTIHLAGGGSLNLNADITLKENDSKEFLLR